MRERKASARENEKTKVHRWEVEGKAWRKKDRGRWTEEGYAMERWWIEEGREDEVGIAASKGCFAGWRYRGQEGARG